MKTPDIGGSVSERSERNIMTKEHAEFLVNALDYDGQEGELYEDYSGRGMMGETTYGVVFPSESILFTAVMTYLKENPHLAETIPDFEKIKSDNMGRDIIWYWPNRSKPLVFKSRQQ